MARWFSIFLLLFGCGSAPISPETNLSPENDTQSPLILETSRHYEHGGGFSWIPPAEWTIAPVYGGYFKAAHAPNHIDGLPNINVSQMEYVGSPETHLELFKVGLKQAFPKIQFLSVDLPDEFQYARLTTLNQLDKAVKLQTHYFVPSEQRGTTYVFTCSQQYVAENDVALCDASVQSFRFEEIKIEKPWYTYEPPIDWQNTTSTGAVFRSPSGSLLMLLEQNFDGDLEAHIRTLLNAGSATVLAREDLQTASGSMTRLNIDAEYDGNTVRQTVFLRPFSERNTMLLFGCIAENQTDLDACEASAKSVQVNEM